MCIVKEGKETLTDNDLDKLVEMFKEQNKWILDLLTMFSTSEGQCVSVTGSESEAKTVSVALSTSATSLLSAVKKNIYIQRFQVSLSSFPVNLFNIMHRIVRHRDIYIFNCKTQFGIFVFSASSIVFPFLIASESTRYQTM